jgi:peptide methionine sulfoxide reductase MsrA
MSAIFYHDDEQKVLAEESMDKLKALAKGKPITTLILPAEKFYIAEE